MYRPSAILFQETTTSRFYQAMVEIAVNKCPIREKEDESTQRRFSTQEGPVGPKADSTLSSPWLRSIQQIF